MLENNPGKQKVSFVKPPPGVPAMPKWLKGEAAQEWRRVVPVLDAMGVLSTLDRAVLSDYCVTWAQIVRIERSLEADAAVVPGRADIGGTVRHPLWSVLNQLRQRLHKSCDLLGLAPAPRGRIEMPEQPIEDDPEHLLD